ncbi:electron transfer flavoprotein beta subunit lysine methyltransferase-like isoform X1 [Culex pipiens pallens]|uniref:electron transfer flavoprotein beta subunit lysine methyltransferase-like isoform X1 n=2 Tax=Culex pipiens pallens TaxID=42434 RepID=UPI0022AA0D06|nr:electron transfer flavoprotein beta subunit lysine methyltransferase-like isoform X1 [Culex pipiens pallens]XP_052567130.1 electron transfer flavoprotein beta subunit lysine methyltransferase-like isoform X1 [Culex pipiens pallens]XP_052567131.1 electron transfer flavoprotein beta subunit lysine methyltransferase-like isoform X1 [Culex pipiens pallens]XP_052567132.1 electron transfer flavoprotein beta subunit lysine methyltransferase-like isoform X1 [Culex pipiens pallens]XP_052567133.1 elec
MLLRKLVARCQSAASGGGVFVVAAAAANLQPCLLRRFQPGSSFCYHDAVDYHDDGSTNTGKNGGSMGETPRQRPMPSVQVPDGIDHLIQSSSPCPPQTSNSLRSKILRNTCISRHHLTPEIALRLITPECDIYHRPIAANSEDGGHGFDADPFWGFYWPGGQALTRFILDNGHLFEGRRVLDVGCGCGTSSIAASRVAASHVVANDIDHAALEATRVNAELNQITDLELDRRNRIGDVNDSYDVVLIGDLFYDTEIADLLLPWLAALTKTARKTEIYVGDPGRHGLTRREGRLGSSMTQLARYELPANVCIENNGFSHATVWKFEGEDFR